MAIVNNTIIAPVPIPAEINQVLGTAHTALNAFCQDSHINQWAKYKPVGKAKTNTDDELDSNKNWLSTSTWWKGNITITAISAGTTFLNVTNSYPAAWITICGIKYLGFTNQSDILKIFDPAQNHWVTQRGGIFAENYTHVPPQGGLSEPFRLTDFNGYDHNAFFAAFPDYQTSLGTIYVNINDAGAVRQTCSIIDYAEGSTLNFNNIFSGIDNNASFVVIVGRRDGANLTLVLPSAETSVTNTRKDYIVLMNSLQSGYTYIGFYCAQLTINGTTYYVPLMQSGGDTPNFNFPISPKTRAWKSWYLTTSVINNMTAWFKNNYDGTYRQLTSGTGGSYGNGNTVYLKMTINNTTTSSMYITKDTIKVEVAGRFTNNQGSVREAYYEFANGDGVAGHITSFALRDDEQSQTTWVDEGGFTIPPNTSKTLYLAMYNTLNDVGGNIVTKGGTIYRMSIWLRKTDTQPSAVFGAMTESDKLNISVTAL